MAEASDLEEAKKQGGFKAAEAQGREIDEDIDSYINKVLDMARMAKSGTWKPDDVFPRLSYDLLSEIAEKRPDEMELYLGGIRELPDPALTQFFFYPQNTKWTREMIEKELTPFLNISRTGVAPTGTKFDVFNLDEIDAFLRGR